MKEVEMGFTRYLKETFKMMNDLGLLLVSGDMEKSIDEQNDHYLVSEDGAQWPSIFWAGIGFFRSSDLTETLLFVEYTVEVCCK